MQNLPKIKKKKVTPFKSTFLESFTKTKNANSLHSENPDETLMKVNAYNVSSFLSNEEKFQILPKESKNLGLIKRDFKKIFNNDGNNKSRKNGSFSVDNFKKNDKISIHKNFSIYEDRQKSEQKPPDEKNSELPKINAFEFKKFLGKKIKERKWNQMGSFDLENLKKP